MKKLLFFQLIIFLSFNSSGQPIINTSLQACSSTANTLDFDIYITNATANTAPNFILQSGAYGLDFKYSHINNGGVVSIAYVPGTSQLAIGQSNFNGINTSINASTKSIRINAQVITVPVNGTPLPPGVPVRVGTFRLTNTANWTADSSPDFKWVLANITNKTRTKFTVYVNGASLATVFNPALNNVSFSSPCAPLILNSSWEYFSVAHQLDFSSITNKIIKISQGKYLVIGAYGGSQTRRYPYVFCVNDSGRILFDKNPFTSSTMENYDVTNIVKTADSNFVFIGHGDLCDVGFGEVYAEKIDTSGTTIWSKTYQFNSFYNSNHHLAELPNGDFAFVLNDKLFFINNVGDSISSITLPNDSINSIAVTLDNFLLIGNKNSIEKRDLNGNLISSKLFANGVDNIIVEDTFDYVFNSSTILYRTDSMFTTVDSSDLQLSVSVMNDITADSSGFQILDIQKIVHVNTVFNVDTTVLNIYPHIRIQDILVDNNRLLIAGDEMSFNIPSQPLVSDHPVVKSYDLNYQTQPEVQDAGVIDISSDSVNVYPFGVFSGTTVMFNLYVTVKNFGTNTMHDVATNFQVLPPAIICGAYDETVITHGINVAPQDTVRLYMGAYIVEYNLHPPNLFNLCVWSTSPDNHIDIDHSNDRLCKGLLPVFTSAEENSPLIGLEISPNPTTDNLQINIPKLNAPITISVVDISGKEIIKKVIDQANSTLSLVEINPGMYFLKFYSGIASVTKKIIKL